MPSGRRSSAAGAASAHTPTRRAVGIDLSASAFHVATLTSAPDGRGALAAAAVYLPDELDALVAACEGADDVAIDAPDRPSDGHHAADTGLKKFAAARCAEIAAASQLQVRVPWITPRAAEPQPGWMSLGFRLWQALEEAGHRPMEVYPAGSFWLQERRWPPRKSTPAGLRWRLAALSSHVGLPDAAAFWGHDGVDAVLAAAVALQGRERALVARHDDTGCDSSAIWFLAD